MRRRIAIVVLVILIVAAVLVLKAFTKGPMAFAGGHTVALADYHEADPTGVPQNLANADQVKRGEYLARAADCLVCHTVPGGADYAGGLAFPLPFGTLYSTNITPDKDTGIGNYSDQDFLDALRRGKRRDGTHLYPAMPYTSYTYITDADGLAIKTYLFSLPAVITGGEATNPLWVSEVDDAGFTEALSSSLDSVGLLGAQGSCRYFIDVDLLGLSQPTFGFTFEVTSHANYKVYDAGGKSALLATIAGAYTADFAEAPVGSMRLKRANEGAIRASITQFLDRLRTIK
jgi:hypothetical protein